MLYLSRSASLKGFAEVATAFGLDPLALVRELGLPPACLLEPDIKIPTQAVIELLELGAERSGASDFGLRASETHHFSTMGALGLALREQPTVRSALELLAERIWTHVEGLTLEIEEEDGIVVVTLVFNEIGTRGARQASELSVAVIVRLLRQFLGSGWRPKMVTFSHARPATLARYIRVFGQAPVFRQQSNTVVVEASALDAENPAADPVSARLLSRYLENVAGAREATLSAKIDEIVHLLLPRGECGVDRVASYLIIDRRTIHRRLAREGTSFSELVQRARVQLCRAYLSSGDRSLTEISGLLGFSCLSAFSRWRRVSFQVDSHAEAGVQ